jgi:hypothetical protein
MNGAWITHNSSIAEKNEQENAFDFRLPSRDLNHLPPDRCCGPKAR